jgi:predicted  nucleic acid-binding Zn-ribbon protein
MPRALIPLILSFMLAVLALAGCTGQSSSRDAELKVLRERVERLERETAEDRARLAEDVNALRASLDEANQRLAALDSSAPPAHPAQPGKSPRAALRESLRDVMEMSRQALDRLNQSLDKSLERPKAQEPAPSK